ncbi:MAG: hypothetical protein ACKOJF_25465, partial [Planctomycetaceae bacterium]
MRMATPKWLRQTGVLCVGAISAGVLLGTLASPPARAEPDRDPAFTPEQVEFFQEQVEPILK